MGEGGIGCLIRLIPGVLGYWILNRPFVVVRDESRCIVCWVCFEVCHSAMSLLFTIRKWTNILHSSFFFFISSFLTDVMLLLSMGWFERDGDTWIPRPNVLPLPLLLIIFFFFFCSAPSNFSPSVGRSVNPQAGLLLGYWLRLLTMPLLLRWAPLKVAAAVSAKVEDGAERCCFVSEWYW